MSRSRTSTRSLTLEFLQGVLGIFFMLLGIRGFLLPFGLMDGGVTGVALILTYLTDGSVSLFLLLGNLPFLIIGFFSISRGHFFRSLLGLIILAISVEVVSFPQITDDKLLNAVFGGLSVGIGMGLGIRGGAVLDGLEILAIYLSRKWRITIGGVMLGFNFLLFLAIAFLLSYETALYSIIAFLLTTRATDYIIQGMEEYIGVTIISPYKSQEIRRAIIEILGVGVTVYKGEGGMQQDGKATEINILHTIVTRIDIGRLHAIVDRIDPQAFMTEYDVHDVRGGMISRLFQK